MAERDSLGIGFVGAGFITDTFHSETLRGIRHAHGAGVMNPTRSKAAAVADTIRENESGDPSPGRLVTATRSPSPARARSTR